MKRRGDDWYIVVGIFLFSPLIIVFLMLVASVFLDIASIFPEWMQFYVFLFLVAALFFVYAVIRDTRKQQK